MEDIISSSVFGGDCPAGGRELTQLRPIIRPSSVSTLRALKSPDQPFLFE
jgi:hypothetical protein